MEVTHTVKQDEFDKLISDRTKLIRTEAGITQDRFAEMIGISKKTLVEVEKGRKTFGFTTSVTTCVLFRHGEIIKNLFGDAALEVIDLCASNGEVKPWIKTLGGLVFWNVIRERNFYRIQHNRVTGHYRILDPEDYLLYSSFDLDYIEQRFQEISEKKE